MANKDLTIIQEQPDSTLKEVVLSDVSQDVRSNINAAEDIPRQDGYIYLTSIDTAATISVVVKHDGAGGCTGICYSVNGGAAVYGGIAPNTNLTLTPPTAGGGSFSVEIWPATSATSGRVGNLTYLYAYDDSITSLDLTNCPTLTYVYVRYNELTTLDVSNNTVLTYLNCSNNPITSLYASNNAALEVVEAAVTNLTDVDLSNISTGVSAMYFHSCPFLNSITVPSENTFSDVVSDPAWLDIRNCNFNETDLNTLYSSLDPTPAGSGYLVVVTGNPGTATDDVNLAPAAYAVIGS